MLNIFIIASKYIIIILFAVYTLQSFLVIKSKNEISENRLLKSQNLLMFIIHFLSFFMIFIKTETINTIIFYGCQLIFLILFLGITNVFFEKRMSRALLNNICMMMVIGFIILTRLSFDQAVRQFQILLIGSVFFILILFFYRVYKMWPYLKWVYCGVGIFLLLMVFVFAGETYGAKISIDFGFFSIQPLEFVKILFVLFLASIFNRSTNFKNLIISALIAGVHILILVLCRDLGSALIFFLVYLFVLYVSTGRLLYFLGGLITGSIGAFFSYFLFSHVRVRVAAWLNPWPLIDSQGYQITQSLFAIGTGGWLGLGLFGGMPDKIPVVEQDFVFSAISEEMGGFFAICLILICLSTFLMILKIAINQNENFFNRTVVLGLGITYGVQVILTLGGAIKMIPSTGVTFPLISYGGSSILATMIIFGIIQANYSKEVGEEEKNEEIRK